MKKLYEDINIIIVESDLVDLPVVFTKNYMNVDYLYVKNVTGLNRFYADNGLSLGLKSFNRFSKAEIINDRLEVILIKDMILCEVMNSLLIKLLKENLQWLNSSILTIVEKEKVKEYIKLEEGKSEI